MTLRVALSQLEEGPVVVELAPAGRRRRQAIVVRTSDGIRAFLNECRHLPVPLDALRGEVLDPTGRWLMCRTHGALFRLRDGLCVEGPCEGLPLHPVPIFQDGDSVLILDPGPRPPD